MKRRTFIKKILSAVAVFPFVLTKESPAIIDEAVAGSDYTGMIIFNNVSPDEFEVAKEYYIKNVMQTQPTVFNCKCDFEWIEFDETV